MARVKKTFKAWAIKGEIKGYRDPYFMGIFNFTSGPLKPCQDGLRNGLFRTRKAAKEEAKQHAWCKARAVRVTVTIEEME